MLGRLTFIAIKAVSAEVEKNADAHGKGRPYPML
jgi:hypothetical protein